MSGTKTDGLTIWTHGGRWDWCHLCGARSDHTADIWYPDNAEHGPKGSNYVRICAICAASILNAARGNDPQPGGSLADRILGGGAGGGSAPESAL